MSQPSDIQLSAAEPSESDGGTMAFPELQGGVREVQVHKGLRGMWLRRGTVAWMLGVFLAGAVVYLLGSRAEYSAGATLLPEKQSDSAPSFAGLDLLQQFGGMLGGLSAEGLLSQSNALPVELYPEIAKSTPVLFELLASDVSLSGAGQNIPLETYLEEHKPFSLWEAVGDGVGELSALVTQSDRPRRTSVRAADSSIVQIDKDRMDTLEDLRDRVSADLDKKTGLLRVTVTMPDPDVSAQSASALVRALTAYVTRYRLAKLEQDLSFISGRYEEARRAFNASADELARFKDRNQHLARNLAQTEEQRLEAEYELAFSVYSSLATKLEETKIRVQEHTPVFQVLQPVTVPLEKSRPKTFLVLFLGLLLGLVASVAVVLSDVNMSRVRRTFRRDE